VGLSNVLPLALAFSVIPRLRPQTRLAVRSARSGGRAGLAAFPCSARFTGWFRSALYTGSLSIRGELRRSPPPPDCMPSWPKPDQSLWLACVDDAYERSFGFNPVIRF
jgi:hypothetical protein